MEVTLWVDALQPQLSGIGRYTWELSRGLSRHRDVTKLNCYARGRLVGDPAPLLKGELPPRSRLFKGIQGRLDRRAIRASLFHGPNYFLPSFVERGVITVHDLSVFKYPETHPVERVKHFERDFASALGRAQHIVTDTETIRKELLTEFGLPPERVSAVHLGVDSAFGPRLHSEVAKTLDSRGLSYAGYGLCVSTLEPRKKISELIAAWRRLPGSLRSRFPLALAGGAGWQNEGLHAEIAQGAAEGWLRPLGFVAENELPHLYAGASLFVYPSTYEGFGLPPLEAMASGIPVLVAARSCLPEVCGPAALYVDPDDDQSFPLVLQRALEDEAWRSRSVKVGLARALTFTWERCVQNTVAAYHAAEGDR